MFRCTSLWFFCLYFMTVPFISGKANSSWDFPTPSPSSRRARGGVDGGERYGSITITQYNYLFIFFLFLSSVDFSQSLFSFLPRNLNLANCLTLLKHLQFFSPPSLILFILSINTKSFVYSSFMLQTVFVCNGGNQVDWQWWNSLKGRGGCWNGRVGTIGEWQK